MLKDRLTMSEAAKVLCLTAFLLSAGPFFAGAAETPPWDNSALLRDLTEAPSVPYVSEEEQEKTFRKMKEADTVVSGILADAVLVRLGLEGPPVPVVRVTLENLRVYKGQGPPPGSFLYRGSPERLKALRNRKVIALLKLPGKGRGETVLEELFPAYKENLQLVSRLQPPAGADCAPAADACSEGAV